VTDSERVLRLLNSASVKQADMAFVLGLSTLVTHADAPSPLRSAGAPSEGARLG
jgi:hypothetical protein